LIGLKITVKQGDSADGNLNEQDLWIYVHT
jgi:hypothetical protein